MNYLDVSMRGVKFQIKKIPNSMKRINAARSGAFNPKKLKWLRPIAECNAWKSFELKSYFKNKIWSQKT